jgi:glutaredoxin
MSVKEATLYRTVLPAGTCPIGPPVQQLREDNGFAIDDRGFRSHGEVDAFEQSPGVETRPLIFVGDARIGGSDGLESQLSV